MDLYQANILEHYRHPHRSGKIDNPTTQAGHANPLCGDTISIEIRVQKGQITDAKYTGEGCVLSQASASILMDELVGKSVDEVKSWPAQKIIELLNIEVGPNRQKCAMLSLESTQDALKKL